VSAGTTERIGATHPEKVRPIRKALVDTVDAESELEKK
jgi:hypothetical protein